MKAIQCKYILIAIGIFIFSTMFVAQASATDVLKDAWQVVQLQRSTLKNVDDDAGRFQFEGGKVFSEGVHIANYAVTRRVTWGGTDAQNTAMLTMTIFMLGSNPPQNITLQGSHDYSSGRYIGSVSAGSSLYTRLIGAQFFGYTSTGKLYFKK